MGGFHMSERWYYKVTILANSPHYTDAVNPDFIFEENEKDKLMSFIDMCLENAHEINVVKTTKEFDKE
jgi:hypothetical protein